MYFHILGTHAFFSEVLEAPMPGAEGRSSWGVLWCVCRGGGVVDLTCAPHSGLSCIDTIIFAVQGPANSSIAVEITSSVNKIEIVAGACLISSTLLSTSLLSGQIALPLAIEKMKTSSGLESY